MIAHAEIPSLPLSMSRPAADKAEARELARVEDRVAIEACLRGDSSAFDALVVRHQRTIQRVCYRFTGNLDDAADLTQDVFIKAFRSLPKFKGESAFSTWIYRIAVNACLSFKASPRNRTEELDESREIVSEAPGVDEELDTRSRTAIVRAALNSLPEKQRLTVIMKVLEERTHSEVADLLGSNVGTVKANLFFAIRNLRKQLGLGEGNA